MFVYEVPKADLSYTYHHLYLIIVVTVLFEVNRTFDISLSIDCRGFMQGGLSLYANEFTKSGCTQKSFSMNHLIMTFQIFRDGFRYLFLKNYHT